MTINGQGSDMRRAPRAGEPFETPAGRFVFYRIPPIVGRLSPHAVRQRVVTAAKAEARHAGLKVVDVSQAVMQPDERWIVELQIAGPAK